VGAVCGVKVAYAFTYKEFRGKLGIDDIFIHSGQQEG